MIAAAMAVLCTNVPMNLSFDRAAALSAARLAASSAEGDPLPQDGQEGPPDLFPQGRSDLRYVVFENDGPAGYCVIAQSFDGRRVHRLWKMPTRKVRSMEACGQGSLAVALFKLGYVPAGTPRGAVARALAMREGLAGYVFSGPGVSRAWFVDREGNRFNDEPADSSNGFWYPVTVAEMRALGWKAK